MGAGEGSTERTQLVCMFQRHQGRPPLAESVSYAGPGELLSVLRAHGQGGNVSGGTTAFPRAGGPRGQRSHTLRPPTFLSETATL